LIKSSKKAILFWLVSILGLSLILGCSGGSEPAPEKTVKESAPAPTSASASAPAEVFKLKFSSPLAPPPFLISETQKWWADQVAERSDGRIEFTDFYWAGALTKGGETLEAVEVGIVDVGIVTYPYYAGKLPLGNFTYAVPFGSGDPAVILKAIRTLYDTVPALRAETERYNQKYLLPGVIDTYNLTSTKPVVNFEDFDGIKIASIGAYHPKILNAAGATAIHMPVAERYQALQSGVIEAEFLPWDISYAYKYQDFAKHATWVDMGGAAPVGLGINRDIWNSLPQDLKQLMLDVADEAAEQQVALIEERREAAKAGFAEAGVTFHEMPFAEKELWAQALADIPGEWIAEMEEKGLAGEKVMVRYLELLEEAGHEFPREWAADYRD